MKKQLLTLALAAATMAGAFAFSFAPQRPTKHSNKFSAFPGKATPSPKLSTRASESLDFSLAGEVQTALSLNGVSVGDSIYMAFEMSKANATKFAGDSITSINITTGCDASQTKNYINDVVVFITEDLESAPVYTQAATIGDECWTQYKVDLDTPYPIEDGKAFYVGYILTVPAQQSYYVPVDYLGHSDIDGGWIGWADEEGFSWDNLSEYYGFICIGCTITGENMPQNNVTLAQIGGVPYTAPGREFAYSLLLSGEGMSAETVEVSCKIADEDPIVQTVTLEPALGYNQSALITLGGLECNTKGIDLPLTFEITKVNGEDNNSTATKAASYINCFEESEGFDRVFLLEEATGTWCGFCPRGIVMMEYVKENYPELFSLVAIHASQSTSNVDRMEISSTQDWVRAFVGGFPFAMVDRYYELANMSEEEIDQYVAAFTEIPAPCEISDLTVTVDEDTKGLKVDTKVKFGLDVANNNKYRLSYYITEDNVGPYSQTNYYAGGQYGACGGWERKGQNVKTYYNDVCRLMVGGVAGVANSIPADLKAGEEYAYSQEMSASAVKGNTCKVIAFIVDNNTEEIMNSKNIEVNLNPSAVETIASEGNVLTRKFYNLNGVEISEPANGIFIQQAVYSNGTVKTTKVVK